MKKFTFLYKIFVPVVLIVGCILRISAAVYGHNLDIESWQIVAEIVNKGGIVYRDTTRYNYGPPWFHILHILDSFSVRIYPEIFNNLRMKIAVFLTLVDIGIFYFLYKRYSLSIASLFFLNPISIIITGYHSQFDNLALLVGLISVSIFSESESKLSRLVCLLGIGLSLSIKHILFLFPIWLAFKEPNFRNKLQVILIPYLFFLIGFLWYLPEGSQGILENVFLYKSFNNAPFWSMFFPNLFFNITSKMLLFILVLVFLGLYWRTRKPLDSLHLYLIALVVFSSSVTNQYLSIPVPSMSVLWNWGYGLYTLVASTYLSLHFDGLHLIKVEIKYGYEIVIFALGLGLFVTSYRLGGLRGIHNFFIRLKNFLADEVRAQIKSPW